MNLAWTYAVLAGVLVPSIVLRATEDLPIVSIADVAFRVSDLGKARAYYAGVLGMTEAFDLKDNAGGVTAAYFKVNDKQFIVAVPGLSPNENNRLAHVAFLTSDAEVLRRIYEDRGLNPTEIENCGDGNRSFSVRDPGNTELQFVQYMPNSQQRNTEGQFLNPNRASMHLYHVGIMAKDRAATTAFYKDKLGFEGGRSVPGGTNEFLELASGGIDLETKEPPLPDTPATHDQYVREQWGAAQHVGLEVADIREAVRLTQGRGQYSNQRVAPHIGNNRHWLMNIFDPDGSRTELMEPTVQPPAPGAPATGRGTAR